MKLEFIKDANFDYCNISNNLYSVLSHFSTSSIPYRLSDFSKISLLSNEDELEKSYCESFILPDNCIKYILVLNKWDVMCFSNELPIDITITDFINLIMEK